MQDPFRPSRRRLLKAIGATVPASAAVLAAAQGPTQSAASPQGTAPAAQPASSPQGAALENPVALFFNADERITVDAIVARLIPADELGPGAKEAGVTTFLDRQLGGAYGAGAHFYRQGPFQPGTPEQGYQLPLTPAECYRLGLAALDRACETQYGGKRFAQLDVATQDTVLSALESGKLALDPLPGPVFFQMLLDGAIEGFFPTRSTAATATWWDGSSSDFRAPWPALPTTSNGITSPMYARRCPSPRRVRTRWKRPRRRSTRKAHR